MCRSLWQTPVASVLSSTSVPAGTGSGRATGWRGAPNSPTAKLRIFWLRSRHRPGQLVASGPVMLHGLRRIAVDEGAAVERVLQAAHLVVDGEEHRAGVEIDNVLEAVLMLVAFLKHQAALHQ